MRKKTLKHCVIYSLKCCVTSMYLMQFMQIQNSQKGLMNANEETCNVKKIMQNLSKSIHCGFI